MYAHTKIGMGLLVGFGLGVIAAQGLYAQPKPMAYVISEIEVTNADAYAKEYVPLANKALADSGQCCSPQKPGHFSRCCMGRDELAG